MTLAIGHLGRNDVCVLDAALEMSAAVRSRDKRWPSAPPCCAVMASRRSSATNTPANGRALGSPSTGSNSSKARGRRATCIATCCRLLNARRVELLDLPRLSAQLCGLERRTARCGPRFDRPCPGRP